MPRVKLEMPAHFPFMCSLPVRIADINYGGHLGNDAVLSLFHEARVQYLKSLNCSELDACGTALIMADVVIVYKNEGFYGDVLQVAVAPEEISSRGFALFYRISCDRNNALVTIAEGRTGMLCFNYETRKVVSLPEALKKKFGNSGPNVG